MIIIKKFILFIIGIFLFTLKVSAVDLTTNAKSAILIEPTTNSILYEFNIHERRPPASMTKLMTMLLIMEAIDDGRINLDDMVTISKNASSMGGSQVFLQENMQISVHQLLKGIAIASGNDAAVAMAEYISGTTEEFVNKMNEKAAELGLNDTHFVNVHGLDAENHYSSAYDMSQIARELLNHPKILEYTSLYEDYLEKPDGTKTWLVNTNKLVRFYPGVDGLKTGFTNPAGYCLTATAIKNNVRFVTVVMGEDTPENRSADTTSLLNYAFSTYKINKILSKDEIIDSITVKKGKENVVNLVTLEDVNDLIKQNEKKEYSYKVTKFDLVAPIKKGDIAGELEIVDNNNQVIKKISLTVDRDVKKHSFGSLFYLNFKKVLTGI